MARIDVNKHFKDATGNQYDIHMTNQTQGSQKKVLDGLCKFIDQTAVNGPGIVWTGWVEVTPGNFLYWVDSSSSLCAHLNAQANAQHPGNFLAFTQAGNQITITNFGTLCWDKTWNLSKVKAARKKAKDSTKEVEKELKRLEEEKKLREKEDPLKSKKKAKKSKPRTRLSGWKATKTDEALADADMGKFVEPPTKITLKSAAKVGKDVAKFAAKEGTKAALASSTKKKSGLGISAGKERLEKGDHLGAGLEVASGTASLVPGVGTAVSIGIDAVIVGKDVYDGYKKTKQEEKENLSEEDIAKRNTEIMILLLEEKIKEYKNAEVACNHCVQGCDQLIALGKKA